jgi:hypothetical protein
MPLPHLNVPLHPTDLFPSEPPMVGTPVVLWVLELGGNSVQCACGEVGDGRAQVRVSRLGEHVIVKTFADAPTAMLYAERLRQLFVANGWTAAGYF